MPQTVPPALTARCAHNGLDHNVRSKPLGRTFYCCSKLVIKLITYDKLQIFFSNNLYDPGGFTAHWEDLADERNAAASRRRVCLRYRQAMRSIALNSFPVIPSCPERVQRVKRNPNLNSAESSLGTFLVQERYRSKKKKLVDFLSRKSKEHLSRKRYKQKSK